ncbi:putative WD repeat-containing protein 96-like [Apostichopus japonicus]|uniref:Putative WD repeat-containing protein 96-like n=1 Tax=Stichopus japonicus TaxID=307972 RepID=A0A2G8LE92_STIJA|nr:putative WD repeat-containing protein 96-like [Apostichopus japonicus]
MGSMGNLSVKWAHGYNGSTAAFVKRNILCHACGSNVKFIDISNNTEVVHASAADGIGVLTVSASQGLVAFSELAMNPRIFVHSFVGFTEKTVCQGGAKLQYSSIAISQTHSYMISCSALPDFSVYLWHMDTGALLCSESMSGLSATQVSFNPTDWHKICITGPEQLQVWTVEQADELYKLTKHTFKLPFEGGTVTAPSPDAAIFRPSSGRGGNPSHDVFVDDAAVAGIVGTEAENFEANFDENVKKLEPVSHCWTPTGDVYCGCQGGQLLKVDTEKHQVNTILSPQSQSESLERDNNRMASMPEDSEMPTKAVNKSSEVGEGNLQCIALHQDGLFVGGDDGVLRCLDVTSSTVQVVESFLVGAPISSLDWSLFFNVLAIGSSKGSVHIFDVARSSPVEPLFETHFGNFVGIAVLSPGTTQCVSVREDGMVQTWSMEESKLLGSCMIGAPVSCMASSPSSSLVAVGSLSGHMYLIDASNPEKPRVVQRLHVHKNAILELTFDQEGRYLISGSDDGNIFTIDARPSAGFKILGQTPLQGLVTSLSTVTEEKHGPAKVLATGNSRPTEEDTSDVCLYFEIPMLLIKVYHLTLVSFFSSDIDELVSGTMCEFKEDVVNRMVLSFSSPVYTAAISSGGVIYASSSNQKKLTKFALPNVKPSKRDNASILTPEGEYAGHDLHGGSVVMSHHQKWIATSSPDGRILVRDVDSLDEVIAVTAHSHQLFGVYQMNFSTDALHLLSCGAQDASLACFSWDFTPAGKTKAAKAIEAARSHKAMLQAGRKRENEVLAGMKEWQRSHRQSPDNDAANLKNSEKARTALENALESDDIYSTPTPSLGSDPTWMEMKELEAIRKEDMEYAEVKKGLRSEIRDLRRTIQTMMKTNEELPEIEQLGQHEFNLDTEEQQRLQEDGDGEVQKIREEMELEDLAKMYLRDVIMKECWESMVTKGRSIKAFHSTMEVSNYPMRERSKTELEELAFVTKLREIERAEIAARKEILDVPAQQTEKDGVREGDEESEEGGDTGENPSTTGSLGAQYGGASELFYSQFDLNTRPQKRNQIILIQDAIYRIKQQFNKEFSDTYKQREQEIARIEDKNQRIRKILEDLKTSEDIWQPQMDSDEKPEKLLTVDDSEVKVDKFITPDQQAKLDEEAKAEAEKKLKEKGDNVRDRALNMMMGGVLEIKKEDELKKDVTVPSFMTNKPQDEWSEEEQKAAKEYERKVKELNDEREKYRKTLDAELKKLQTIIADTTSNFDDKLLNLLDKKIKTEMVLFQEELKALRLKRSLLIEEELNCREEELTRQLETQRSLKVNSSHAVVNAKKIVDGFRDTYDIKIAEDKILDKSFKKEFPDIHPILVDQLYKLFRRRPRGPRKELRASISDGPPPAKTGNPYGERPLSARQPSTTELLLKALEELDADSHMPEGIELPTWKHMCKIRREKLISEQEVK